MTSATLTGTAITAATVTVTAAAAISATPILGPIPVIGFVAPSGTGKTTLLRQLVPLLRQRGLAIGYLKHTHHRVEVDKPGKDSFEIRAAGASQVLLASGERWVMQSAPLRPGPDPDLGEMLARFDPGLVDLILVEGFKGSDYPKLEVHRTALKRPYLYPQDPAIRALITDGPPPFGAHPPLLPLAGPAVIADFILALVGRGNPHPSKVSPSSP
jgi:molybdopterin-guanine dinucleotide biosynthesis protein B